LIVVVDLRVWKSQKASANPAPSHHKTKIDTT